MNLLAHLHLGDDLPPMEAAGNLAADFCHTAESEPYRAGVRLHQAIDSFTDSHPLVGEAHALFPGAYRRFAGVLCDLAFDHCLARSWNEWVPTVPMSRFIDDRMAAVLRSPEELPEKALRSIQRMRRERWLHSYVDMAGIAAAITRIAGRRPFARAMLGSEKVVEQRADQLQVIFQAFYPDLIARVGELGIME